MELPLEAQLNCDTDREATVEHSTGDQVPPLLSTPSLLVIQQGPLQSSHIRPRIRCSANLPAWTRYIKDKIGWSDQVYNQTDWTTYHQIIKKYRNKWTTMVKHLHDVCLTGHIAHRNNKHLPHECPTCSSPHEDNHYILTCPHPKRREWRTQTIHKVMQHESNKIDPYLLDILRDGLTRYHRQLHDLINPNSYPPKYTHLITQQNNIGRIHIYRGQWSTEWMTLQDSHNASQNVLPPQQQITGTQWLLAIGCILIDQWFQLWKQRNEDRHGVDTKHHSTLCEQQLHNEIRELYTYRDQVCQSDKGLFS